MTGHNFEFTVLRIVPNVMRGECLNVGIAVFHPDGNISIHLDASHNRLRSFDPNLTVIRWDDWQHQASQCLAEMPANSRKYWLTHGMRPVVADEQHGWFSADDEGSFEDSVRDLLRRLVTAPTREMRARRTVAPQPARLHAQWKGWFKAQHIMGKHLDDLAKSQIVEAFPVSLETDTYAEFAFKNGAIHVMETLDLRNVEHLTQRQRNQAAFKSVVLDEARAVVSGGGRRIAVVSATDYNAVRSAVRMIERTADDVFHMESADDVSRLVRHIGDALHLPQQLDSSALLLA